MDVNMPGIGGVEATRRIRKDAPQVKVIAVTVLSEDPFPNQLLDAGALGYISKGSGSEEMLDAIRAVMRGQHYISIDVARKLTLASFRSGGESSPFAYSPTTVMSSCPSRMLRTPARNRLWSSTIRILIMSRVREYA
jgi:two-component system invasion response regulator UvrY